MWWRSWRDEDFEDGHHELLSGANRFTDRLAQEIQRLLAQPEVSAEPAASAENDKTEKRKHES